MVLSARSFVRKNIDQTSGLSLYLRICEYRVYIVVRAHILQFAYAEAHLKQGDALLLVVDGRCSDTGPTYSYVKLQL